MAIDVIRYEESYREQLLIFLTKMFPESPWKGDRRFFHWRFEDGPFGNSLEHCFLAVMDGRIVGQAAGIRDRIWVKREWRDCAWMIDLFVLPECRGGHTALRLYRAVMGSADLLLVVGAGAQLIRFFQAFRWRHVHVADTYFAVFRPLRLWELGGAGAQGWRRWIMNWSAPACCLFHSIHGIWAERGPDRVEITAQLPAGVPGLAESLLPALGVTTDRSEAVLDWKFSRRACGRQFFVAIHEAGRGTLRAYAAVKLMQRGDTRWAEVVDDLSDEVHMRQLMGAIVREALRLGVDFVRTRGPLDSLQPPIWIKRNRPVIDDLLIYSKDKELVDILESSTWYLTTIVSDRTDHGGDESS